MPTRDPPVPILAQWFGFPGPHLIVTFQHQLEPGPVNHGNWSAMHALTAWDGTAAVVAGNKVTVQMANVGIGNLPSRCTYAPPPLDVRTPNHVTADAFADYPIT